MCEHRGVCMNSDEDLLYHWYRDQGKSWENYRENLERYVEPYLTKNISDVILNVFGQTSVTTTEKAMYLGVKWLEKKEDGSPADWYLKGEDSYIWPYYARVQMGLEDPYRIWFDYLKKRGKRTWISFRMNDFHYNLDKYSPIRSDFQELALQKGWTLGEKYGGGAWRNLDFGVEEVRAYMLSYMEEQIDRYDTYGAEMDFSRELPCFKYQEKGPEEICPIMTEFVRQVRHICSRSGKKLMVRLGRELEHNRIYGFDVETWAKEGLVDIVVPSPRWVTSDSHMPVKEWMEKLHPYGVQVYAGLECNVIWEKRATPEVFRGLAAHYDFEGADGIYLYNCTGRDAALGEEKVRRERENWNCRNVTLPRRHIVMWQDVKPEQVKAFDPLPDTYAGTNLYRLGVGKVPEGAQGVLFVGYREEEPRTVRLNGKIMEPYAGSAEPFLTEAKPKLEPFHVNAYRTDGALTEGWQQISVEFEREGTLSYLEIWLG